MNASLNHSQNMTSSLQLDTFDVIHVFSLIVLSIFSVILNSVSILIFVLRIKKRTFSNFLYISNCTADLIVGLFIIPMHVAAIFISRLELYYDKIAFSINNFVDDTLSCVSLVNLFFMSFHRLFQLKFPLSTTEKISKKSYAIIFSAWLGIALFWLGQIIVELFYQQDCEMNFKIGFELCGHIMFYCMPLFFIVLTNSLTIHELRKRHKVKQSNGLEQAEHVTHQSRNSKYKLLRPYACLFLVSVTMILSFTLYTITFPIYIYCEAYLDAYLREISVLLTYLIVVMNPIIILIFQESFKNECIKFFNKLK